MNYAAFGLICLAAPLQAQDLCGASDEDAVFQALAGEWGVLGGLAWTENTETVTNGFFGALEINDLGMVVLEVDGERGDNAFVRTGRGEYSAQGLQKALARTNATWILDDIAATACDLDDVAQLRATYDNPQGDLHQITILPYSAESAVMIVEVETVGDYGLAFVTLAGLMSRVPDAPQE